MNESFDIKKFISEAKRHLNLELNYSKLTAVEKVAMLLSQTALVAVFAVIACFAFFYFTTTLTILLTQWTGIEWLGSLIMGLLLSLAIVVVYAFRKPWIIDPITRFLTKLFLKPNDDE